MPPLYVGREEVDQCLRGAFGGFFCEIMSAVHAEAAHVARPFPPCRERVARLGGNTAGCAPDRKHRTADFPPGSPVGLVVRKISGPAGAVVLADGMNAQGIVEKCVIMCERSRIEGGDILDLGAGGRARIEEEDRVLANHRLGEWCR